MNSSNERDPKASPAAVVGVVFAVATFVLIVLLQWFFYSTEQAETQQKMAAAPEERAQLETKQQEQLHGYRWVDKSGQVISIPIDLAMQRVVTEAGRPAAPSATRPTTRPGGSP